jgi:hypothetical protein
MLIFYKQHPEKVKKMIENARKKITEKYNINCITNQILEFVLNK